MATSAIRTLPKADVEVRFQFGSGGRLVGPKWVSISAGVQAGNPIQERIDKRQRSSLRVPFAAFPPAERSFVNAGNVGGPLYRQPVPPAVGEQFLFEADRF